MSSVFDPVGMVSQSVKWPRSPCFWGNRAKLWKHCRWPRSPVFEETGLQKSCDEGF